MDNSETYQYLGNFVQDNLGTKNLPAGIVGTIAENNLTIFQNAPYNLIFIGPNEFMGKFEDITKNPPKIINNEIPTTSAPGGSVFFDIPPKS